MNTTPFEQLLKSKIGLDAESIGVSTIQRAIRSRAQLRSGGDLDAYWHALQGSASELQALIETVVVPETWFFRYPESITLFAAWASAQLAEPGNRPPLRILSLPCSTGEEPYTLAMALLDAGVAPARFTIEAVDISPRAIDVAQMGCYGRNSFRGDDLAYRERHFTETADGFVLSSEVRERVRFRTGNLLEPGLALEAAAYDFVFCRNLLIYFDRETQSRGLRVLLRACHAGSGLFVGPAEASLASQHGLAVSGAPRSFAFKIRGEPLAHVATVATAAARPLSVGATPLIARTFHERDRSRPVRSAQMAGSAMPAAGGSRAAAPIASAHLRDTVASPSQSETTKTAASTALDRTAILSDLRRMADAGRIDDALAQTQRWLTAQGPDPDGFYLVGLFHDARGERVLARDYYRKALYLAPNHDEALLHLAALCEASGDMAAAQRLRARRAKQVSRNA